MTDSITQAHFKLCKLHTGEKYDVTSLKAERDRIETDLKNSGFFFFGKEYVAFDCDTNQKPKIVNVTIRINQPSDSIFHQQYKINEIYVTTDFGAELSNGGPVKRDTTRINEFYFMTHKRQ
jgi:hypothetical protein